MHVCYRKKSNRGYYEIQSITTVNNSNSKFQAGKPITSRLLPQYNFQGNILEKIVIDKIY